MLYTTIAAIFNRLEGRLVAEGAESTFGDIAAKTELVEQIAEQVEKQMDLVLGKRYVIPLSVPSNPLLASIAEKLICAELVDVYFSGSDRDSISNYAELMREQGEKELMNLVTKPYYLEDETLATKAIAVVAKQASSYTERKAGFKAETNYKKGDVIVPVKTDSIKW